MDKICGTCHYYANSPVHGPWCTKNRKEAEQKEFEEFKKQKGQTETPVKVPRIEIHHELREVEIVNDMFEESVPLLTGATDDEIVEELRRRGYQGNIIKKVSFIL